MLRVEIQKLGEPHWSKPNPSKGFKIQMADACDQWEGPSIDKQIMKEPSNKDSTNTF
jgi:hypothetical protein